MKSFLVPIFAILCSGCSGDFSRVSELSNDQQAVYRAGLRAQDKTEIVFTYEIEEIVGSSERRQFATDVSLKVQNSAWNKVSGARKVRAVLLGFCRSSRGGAEYAVFDEQFDVPYASEGYEVRVPQSADDRLVLGVQSISGAAICRQEIALSVDESWMVDPVNGTHNFQLNLAMH